jgi:FAD/FMN-containing dehydrogenase
LDLERELGVRLRKGAEGPVRSHFTFSPRGEDELVSILRKCGELGVSVCPICGNCHQVGPLVKVELALDLSGFNRIKEVSKEDLYLVAGPGLTVEEAKSRLSKEGLFFPFDYSGSLGGLTATNSPDWFTYPKEFLLGGRIVTGDGVMVKSGGKTPKFSSGYKTWKVVAGSLGWLGVFTEVIYKLLPRPEAFLRAQLGVDQLTQVYQYSPLSVLAVRTDREYLVATFGGPSKTISRIPFQEADPLPEIQGDRVAIVSPLGLELEYARLASKFLRANASISLVGKGYSRLYVEDLRGVEELRKIGVKVIVESGDFPGDYWGFRSRSLELLKRSLDPKGILCPGRI